MRRRFHPPRVVTLAAIVLAFGAAGCVVAPAPAPNAVAPITTTTASPVAPPLTAATPPVSCPAPTSLTPTRVIVYGDSLAREAEPEIEAQLCDPTVDLRVRAQPGAALCDFTSLIESEAATLSPAMVILEFSGNNITSCTQDATGHPLTGTALWALYEHDADQVTAALSFFPITVYWVTPPGRVGGGAPPLADTYARVVTSNPATAHLMDGGAALRDAMGNYALELPCLPEEEALSSCFQHRIIVRLPLDGFHFCPVLSSGACPVYDAGALRFGRTLAQPVRAALGL